MYNFNERIIKRVKENPYVLFYWLMKYTGISYISDYVFLKTHWRLHMGYALNLINPKSFSEKLQWIKLYDRNPLYTRMVDKYAVKEYVGEIIGEHYVVPTIAIWDRVEDIKLDNLPHRFVLKCTHDSGSVIICKDKQTFNFSAALKKLEASLKTNYYKHTREWPYKNVRPRVIAEVYLDELASEDLIDYKFFCFNGVPTYCQVIKNRSTDETIDFFDMDWIHQDFIGLNPVGSKYSYKNSFQAINRPVNFEIMIQLAKQLSYNIPFVRVDFYNIQGRIYFGELTFFPANGMGIFTPEEWNNRIGEHLILPSRRRN